jgi:hypothetical protein
VVVSGFRVDVDEVVDVVVVVDDVVVVGCIVVVVSCASLDLTVKLYVFFTPSKYAIAW